MSIQPKALSDNLVIYSSSFFENTAKVVPPHAALSKGKIVANLGQPRASAGFVSRDLLDASDNFAVNTAASWVPYPLDATTQVNATDNQLIRLQDGSLLASKNGYIWSDLSPRPAWFDTTSITVGGTTTGRARNAVFIFRSTDGGVSWVLLSYIDSAVVENGKYGWPQPGSSPGSFGVGGFDRTELYQDPWSGDIFVSGHGDGGPYTLEGKTTENHAGVIFRSQDNGLTWTTFHIFSDAANKSKGAAPYAMTSTPSHALVVFHIESSKPTLYFMKNGTMSTGKTVVAKDGNNTLNFGGVADVDDIRGSQPCIARMGADSVWIAYPSLNASGKQTYVIAAVTFGGPSDPIVDLVGNVAAENPANASAIMGAFVYSDLSDPDDSNPTPTALFYWIDAPPKTDPAATNKIMARYMVFYSGGSFPASYLSVSGGTKRTFSRVGIGDYFSGGYFWLNDQLNFLCQWNESDGIKANIVSMSPIPKRRDFFEAAIDPLALILSNQVYVLLTLPDPPPPGVLRKQIEAYLRGMSIAQRRAALTNLKQMQEYVDAIAKELK
jgi:hypothetical protein